MVPSRANEVNELQLEHRPLSVGAQAASDTENGRFSEWRIENLLRKFGRKLLCKPENAAFRILDVFAENDAMLVAFQTKAQRLIDGIPNAVFAWRQNLVGQSRKFARHLQVKLVA